MVSGVVPCWCKSHPYVRYITSSIFKSAAICQAIPLRQIQMTAVVLFYTRRAVMMSTLDDSFHASEITTRGNEGMPYEKPFLCAFLYKSLVRFANVPKSSRGRTLEKTRLCFSGRAGSKKQHRMFTRKESRATVCRLYTTG